MAQKTTAGQCYHFEVINFEWRSIPQRATGQASHQAPVKLWWHFHQKCNGNTDKTIALQTVNTWPGWRPNQTMCSAWPTKSSKCDLSAAPMSIWMHLHWDDGDFGRDKRTTCINGGWFYSHYKPNGTASKPDDVPLQAPISATEAGDSIIWRQISLHPHVTLHGWKGLTLKSGAYRQGCWCQNCRCNAPVDIRVEEIYIASCLLTVFSDLTLGIVHQQSKGMSREFPASILSLGLAHINNRMKLQHRPHLAFVTFLFVCMEGLPSASHPLVTHKSIASLKLLWSVPSSAFHTCNLWVHGKHCCKPQMQTEVHQ